MCTMLVINNDTILRKMKHNIVIAGALCTVLVTSCSAPKYVAETDTAPKTTNGDTEALRKGTLIIFYDKEVGNVPLMAAVDEHGAKLVYEYKSLHGIAISLPKGEETIEEMIQRFKSVDGVLSVEQDKIMKLD